MTIPDYNSWKLMDFLRAAKKKRRHIKKHGRPPGACNFCGGTEYRTVTARYRAHEGNPSFTASHQVCIRCHPGAMVT